MEPALRFSFFQGVARLTNDPWEIDGAGGSRRDQANERLGKEAPKTGADSNALTLFFCDSFDSCFLLS